MIVNGKDFNWKKDMTINTLLEELCLDLNTVVVEVNQVIIDKDKYAEFYLDKKDSVEIISFVGGG